MTPSLERLRLLHAVANNGTIAAAARAVGYTASAVSQQLSALERDVGSALLERSNRGVRLTPAGAVLSKRASVILDLVDAAVAEAGHHDGIAATPVRVGAFPTAIASIVLPALPRLAPRIRLTIVDLEPDPALAALLARDLDAAIIDRYPDQPGSLPADVERTTLLVEPLQLITPGRRRPARLADLADHPWVLAPAASRLGSATRSICLAGGFEPDVIAESNDHRVAFDIVRATGAVTIQPASTMAGAPRGVVAAAIDLGRMRHVDLVVRRVPHHRPGLAELTEALLAAAAGPDSRSGPSADSARS